MGLSKCDAGQPSWLCSLQYQVVIIQWLVYIKHKNGIEKLLNGAVQYQLLYIKIDKAFIQ